MTFETENGNRRLHWQADAGGFQAASLHNRSKERQCFP